MKIMTSKMYFMRIAILFIMAAGPFFSSGQTFQKLGNGLSATRWPGSQAMLLDKGNLYVGYYTYGNPGVSSGNISYVEKWDGVSWTTYPSIPNVQVTDLAIYNNQLYAAAHTYNASGNLYRFDGSNWNTVLTLSSGSVTTLEVFNNELICGGDFVESTTGDNGLVSYDGTSVSSLPSLRASDSVGVMEIIDNDLWVGGRFNLGQDTAHVKKLDAGSWVYPVIGHDNSTSGWRLVTDIFKFNGKIYCSEYYGLFEIDNDTAHFVANNTSYHHAEHNSQMFLTGYAGDLKFFDGTSVATVVNAPNNVMAIASNSSGLYGAFPDTNLINGVDFNHIFLMNGQFGLMRGSTFKDNNSNCTYEFASDKLMLRMRLSEQSANASDFYSDYTGDYQVALSAGSYTFNASANQFMWSNQYLVPDCNNASTVTITAGQTVNKDFVVKHDGTVDVRSWVSPYRGKFARQGFTEGYNINIQNPGATISGVTTVEVTIPSTVTFVSSKPNPASTSGNTLTYTFSNLAERSRERIKMSLKVDVATNPINSHFQVISNVLPASGEILTANNSDTADLKVVAACDPNDKTVNIEKSLKGLSSLDYHIRFQNVGTDTAFKVVVMDTLEPYFNLQELTINSVSHEFDFDIIDGNIMVWIFEDIKLPDSTTNAEESMGYIDFTIGVDPSLNIGSTIDNDAEIYFDYQPPVHTNHAKTAIVQFISVPEFEKQELLLDVYPNPARELLHLKNRSNQTLHLSLVDVTGKLIRNLEIDANQEKVIEINDLSTGVYFIQSEQGTFKLVVTE